MENCIHFKNDQNNERSGVVGIFLLRCDNAIIPTRLMDNIPSGYAKLYNCPYDSNQLSQINNHIYYNII